MAKYQQQGDVIIRSCLKPEGKLKPLPHLILAEGEATGHCHEVIGDAQLYADEEGNLFLEVKGPARVGHQEHHEQALTMGWKQIARVREFDHFAEEARSVAD